MNQEPTTNENLFPKLALQIHKLTIHKIRIKKIKSHKREGNIACFNSHECIDIIILEFSRSYIISTPKTLGIDNLSSQILKYYVCFPNEERLST